MSGPRPRPTLIGRVARMLDVQNDIQRRYVTKRTGFEALGDTADCGGISVAQTCSSVKAIAVYARTRYRREFLSYATFTLPDLEYRDVRTSPASTTKPPSG